MDMDAIFSFSSPLKTAERVDVTASPVLELAYVGYFLGASKRNDQDREPPWAAVVDAEAPDLRASFAGFWSDPSGRPAGLEVFVAACQLGYATDATPERFLAELPALPARALKLYQAARDKSEEDQAWLVERLQALREPALAERYQQLYRRLAAVLAPLWQAEGKAVVAEECQRFAGELADGKSVVEALPRHFFARSERLAEQIRTFSEKGRVLVTPVFFSAGGGFAVDTEDRLYIGYGLGSESHFRKMVSQTEVLAGQLKAFADPTRLLVLAMVDRFEVTVSDLAERLELSQPTISGHLKVLRKAGLVEADKQGNKSFYRVRKDAVRALLGEAESLLLHK